MYTKIQYTRNCSKKFKELSTLPDNSGQFMYDAVAQKFFIVPR